MPALAIVGIISAVIGLYSTIKGSKTADSSAKAAKSVAHTNAVTAAKAAAEERSIALINQQTELLKAGYTPAGNGAYYAPSNPSNSTLTPQGILSGMDTSTMIGIGAAAIGVMLLARD